jgi:hypothetical protein
VEWHEGDTGWSGRNLLSRAPSRAPSAAAPPRPNMPACQCLFKDTRDTCAERGSIICQHVSAYSRTYETHALKETVPGGTQVKKRERRQCCAQFKVPFFSPCLGKEKKIGALNCRNPP